MNENIFPKIRLSRKKKVFFIRFSDLCFNSLLKIILTTFSLWSSDLPEKIEILEALALQLSLEHLNTTSSLQIELTQLLTSNSWRKDQVLMIKVS